MPNFLIIGAAKAGTTSLYYYLSQHPQIFMSSNKEPRYFAPEFYLSDDSLGSKRKEDKPLTLDDYYQLFKDVKDELAIGEASPEYIYYPESPHRIKAAIPDVKLIAILRNPIERAFSQYCYNVGRACEPLSFADALAAETERTQQNWVPGHLYQQSGFYYEQLTRYFELFNPDQIRVYLYEDLDKRTVGVCQDSFAFLGVDPQFAPDLARKNPSEMPKSYLLNKLLFRNKPLRQTINRLVPKAILSRITKPAKQLAFQGKPTMPTEARQQLLHLYQDDILKLEKLIQKDLSHWRRNMG